jgi:hypothetical protein
MVPPLVGWCFSSASSIPAIFPPGGGENTILGQFGRNHHDLLLFLNFLLVLVILKFGGEPGRWVLLLVPISFLAPLLTHLESLIRLMPNPSTRALVTSAVPLFTLGAFANGRIDAVNVLQGRAPLIVDIKASGLQLPFDHDHQVAYVGHAGDFYVLYESSDRRLVIMKTDRIQPLVLMKNPKSAIAEWPEQLVLPTVTATPSAKPST